MKRKILYVMMAGLFSVSNLIGCSSTAVEHAAGGAAAGAVSASFVGAMTDLVVDGRVNTYRFARNATAGAIAGGVAGGISGQAKHEAQEKQKQAQQAATAPPAPAADADLAKKIGSENVQGLSNLIQCRHEEAFRIGMRTAQSDKREVMEAGIALQALVDKDRGIMDGADRAVQAFVDRSSELNDVATAKSELNKLHDMLKDERRVQGLSPECSR